MTTEKNNSDVLYLIPGDTEPTHVGRQDEEQFKLDYPEAKLVEGNGSSSANSADEEQDLNALQFPNLVILPEFQNKKEWWEPKTKEEELALLAENILSESSINDEDTFISNNLEDLGIINNSEQTEVLKNDTKDVIVQSSTNIVRNREAIKTNKNVEFENLRNKATDAFELSHSDLFNGLTKEQKFLFFTHVDSTGDPSSWRGWSSKQKNEFILNAPLTIIPGQDNDNINITNQQLVIGTMSGVDKEFTESLGDIAQEQAFNSYVASNFEEGVLQELTEEEYIKKKGEIINSEDFINNYLKPSQQNIDDTVEKLGNTSSIVYADGVESVPLVSKPEEFNLIPEEELNNLSEEDKKIYDQQLKEHTLKVEEYKEYVNAVKKDSEDFWNDALKKTVLKKEMNQIGEKTQDLIDDNWHDNWLRFTRSRNQKDLDNEAVEHLNTLSNRQKGNVSKMAILMDGYDVDEKALLDIENWFKNTQKEIDEISSKEYTTQKDVDLANAKLKRLQSQSKVKQVVYKNTWKRYNNVGKALMKIHGEIQEDGLDQKQLSAYTDIMGRNPSQILNLANSIVINGIGDTVFNIIHSLEGLTQGFDEIQKAGSISLQNALQEDVMDKDLINQAESTFNVLNAVYNYATPMGWFFGDNTFNFKDGAGRNQSLWNEFYDKQREFRNKHIDNKLRPPKMYDEINGGSDWVEWGANMLGSQSGNIALMLTGGYAMPLLMASSMGSKYNQLQEEKEEYVKSGGMYGQNYSFGGIFLNSVVTGVAEGLSEKVTMGILDKTTMALGKGALNIGKKVTTRGYLNHLTKNIFTKKNMLSAGWEMHEEGFSESIATISGNLADIMLGKEDVSVYDGLAESYVSGVLMAGALQSPRLFKQLYDPFRSADVKDMVNINTGKLLEISEAISKENDPKKKLKLESELIQLTSDTQKLIELDVKRVDVMEGYEKSALIEISKRNAKDKKSITQIKADQKLTKEQRDQQVSVLQGKIEARNSRKKKIIERYPANVIDAKYSQQIETMQKMADMAAEHGAPEINIIQTDKDGFAERESKYDQNMSKKQVEDIAKENKGLIKAFNEIINDPNSTKEEIAGAEAALKDANQQVQVADNILRADDYGVMQPKFNKDGKLVGLDIIINKDVAITDGMINTPAHEFIHATFANTLKADPQMRKIMGSQLKTILEGKGVTFSSQSALESFNDRISGYDVDQQGEEMLTIASEMMLDGDITFNDSVLQKLKNVFRRFVQHNFDVSLEFNETNDIKNFLRDYHSSIENNKPNPAIAKMLAKGANGKIFKDARTPTERKNEAMYNRNIQAIQKKNPDWKNSLDKHTLDPDGKKKYNNKEDFQASDAFWEAFQVISKSEGLRNLIASKGIYETGMNDKQEIKDFVDSVVQNVEDRYSGGLTKKAREEIKKIEDKRAKNELTPRETFEAIDKIENNPDSRKKGFDASAANGSLFGWITSVAVPNSILVVKKKFIKEQGGRGKKMSTERQVGEGRTLKDLLPGVTDLAMERFESEIILQKSKIDPVNLKVEDILDFSTKTKQDIIDTISSAGIDITGLTYKDVKKLLSQSNKAELKKSKSKVSDLTITPQGALFKILDNVASKFGDGIALRILAGQDLNTKQRQAAQSKILQMSLNTDGSFNSQLLNMLPEGLDTDGRATGVANTSLKNFYLKGDRVKVKDGALKKLGQNYDKNKRTDVTKVEFLDTFGMNENGTKRPGTKADGAIKELVLQLGQLQANQSLRQHALENDTHPMRTIAKLSDGKSEAMYSKGKPRKAITPTFENIPVSFDVVDSAIKLAESYIPGDSGGTKYDKIKDDLIDQISKEVEPELAESLLDTIEQLVVTNYKTNNKSGYNVTLKNIKSLPLEISKNLNEYGTQVRWDGPKIYKQKTGGYGMPNKAQSDYVSEVAPLIKELTPLIGFKEACALYGIKDSGSKTLDGLTLYSTRSINPKAHSSILGPIENSKSNNTKEVKDFCKKHEIDFDALVLAKPMAYKKDVRKMINNMWSETSIAAKLETLKNSKDNISKMNRGNKAVMKYSAARLMEAKSNNSISDVTLFHMGSMMTNIIEGTRAYSTFEGLYLVDGVQLGMLTKGKDVNAYYKSWQKIPYWKNAEAYTRKSHPDLKGNELKDKIINNLKPYNEHQGASSETVAKRSEVIYSNGQDMSLDNYIDGHKSFFLPGYIAKGFLDAKVKNEQGVEVDNKVSPEGPYRFIKFTGGNAANIYHHGGESVSQRTIQQENISKVLNDIIGSKDGVRLINKTHRLSNKLSSSMKSNSINIKGMSTFDFDDTLASTKSGVRVTIPNKDGKPKPGRKVIFLAGGAGSGKSNVVSKLGLENMGMKIVNQDISLQWLKKNSGLPTDMRDLTKEQRSTLGTIGHQARGIARRKMMKYQGNGNGVVVDGTGASANQMNNLVSEFKSKGYDVGMVFVETSLETSLERNKARSERSLLDSIVTKNHQSVMSNKNGFKDLFGNRFMEVNTDKMNIDSPMPKSLVDGINDYVSGYEMTRLDAESFAEQGDDILKRGGQFDFSEFNTVVDGKEGPLLQKAIQRAKKFGTKDMFILTARPQASAKAIQSFLKSQGLEIPLRNITGLANSSGDAKAQWMLNKFSEGYNDMYFVDDAMKNVEAVKHVLSQLDVKSKVVQAKLKQVNKLIKNGDSMKSKSVVVESTNDNDINSINKEFNDIIEQTTGIDSDTIIGRDKAYVRGRVKGKYDYFIPPSAEDFKGLMYKLLSTGKVGEQQMEWIDEKLLRPFGKGIRDWNSFKQKMSNEYTSLKKQMPNIGNKLRTIIPGTDFTLDTAIRVYLWNKNNIDVPGLSPDVKESLLNYMNSNPEAIAYADALGEISRDPDGYIKPDDYWMVGSIGADLNEAVGKDGRKSFLAEWVANKDIIFSADNLNKLRSEFGPEYIDALQDILYRMENGTNRVTGKNKNVNKLLNWINGSVGATMFFNIRSSALQTISTVNFLNFEDNNIFAAAKAFANLPQFCKDFAFIFNSDMLKQRRGGLQIDVSASELTEVFSTRGKGPRAVLQYLLEIGFTPTRLADSFAIAMGGAGFYRNRYKKLIKEGMSPKEASKEAFLNFQEIAEETQQSSRPDFISQQQAGPLGRLILAWQNTPMQMTRLMKKALSDLVNNRGSKKANISKIMYYGLVQNIIFGSLQSGLAFLMFGENEEEDDEKKSKKIARVANGALDTILRGTGIWGAAISTLKNTAREFNTQRDKGYGQKQWDKVLTEIMSFSPPIGSKLRKIMNAIRTDEYNKGVGRELPFRVENPNYSIFANVIEAVFNFPLARLLNKANNIEEALTGNHETWQRVALLSGWSKWDVGVKDEELEEAKNIAKDKIKEEKKEKKIIEKEKEKQEKIDAGLKQIRCSGIGSNGERCKLVSPFIKEKTWKCVHHMEFKDGMDRDNDGIKEYRCTATKTNGDRCKNKTENKNKKCYAHQ
tara:strand:- start:1438 stop:11751 length:10314 start_codon:yes stop_codon:yes gene_type:complete